MIILKTLITPARPKLQTRSQVGLGPLHIDPGCQDWLHYLTRNDLISKRPRVLNNWIQERHQLYTFTNTTID